MKNEEIINSLNSFSKLFNEVLPLENTEAMLLFSDDIRNVVNEFNAIYRISVKEDDEKQEKEKQLMEYLEKDIPFKLPDVKFDIKKLKQTYTINELGQLRFLLNL